VLDFYMRHYGSLGNITFMKKVAIITLVILATVCFTHQVQAQGILTLPGSSFERPADWPPGAAWPPMPGVVERHRPPARWSVYFAPPELVLPNHGIMATTAGLSPLTPTPEPATYSLLLLGGVAGWLLKRRRVGV
jgi:hypothetical protein